MLLQKNNKINNNLLLVDVDGTISPNQFEIVDNDDYYFSSWNGGHWVSSTLFEALEELPADKIWLTAWGEDAELTFNRGWKTLYFNRDNVDDWRWKIEIAEKFIAENHNYSKLAWIDDELSKWGDKVNEIKIEKLLLPMNPNLGIGPEELVKIKNFFND